MEEEEYLYGNGDLSMGSHQRDLTLLPKPRTGKNDSVQISMLQPGPQEAAWYRLRHDSKWQRTAAIMTLFRLFHRHIRLVNKDERVFPSQEHQKELGGEGRCQEAQENPKHPKNRKGEDGNCHHSENFSVTQCGGQVFHLMQMTFQD